MTTDPPVIRQSDTKQRVLVIWAISATLAALVSTIGLVIVIFLQTRSPSTPQPLARQTSPFLDLSESAVLGTYKWVTKSGVESVVTMNADHTFVKDGKPNPSHRWEITRDALVIFWLRSQTRFNRIERPGVYVEIMDGTETARMEKQE